MTQRRTFDIPTPQSRRAWINSALIAGAQAGLLVAALLGSVPWWGAIAGILAIELGFRSWRKRNSARKAMEDAPTAPSKAGGDEG